MQCPSRQVQTLLSQVGLDSCQNVKAKCFTELAVQTMSFFLAFSDNDRVELAGDSPQESAEPAPTSLQVGDGLLIRGVQFSQL